MAFLDLSETGAQVLPRPLPLPAPAPQTVPLADRLSTLEWRVLEISRDDGIETLQPPRKRSRLATLLFGPAPPSRMLANERLEALRQLAVEARHKGWHVRSSVIAAARKAGFDDEQIGLVIDRIGHPGFGLRGRFA